MSNPTLRDGTRLAALLTCALAIPPRALAMFVQSPSSTYAAFPRWMQALVMAAYVVQLVATLRGGWRQRTIAAVLCFAASAASAVLIWRGDWTSGGWPIWLVMAAIQLWIVTRIAYYKGASSDH